MVAFGVDWNNDGTFTDAAPELVYTSNGIQSIATSFGFVLPNGTVLETSGGSQNIEFSRSDELQ